MSREWFCCNFSRQEEHFDVYIVLYSNNTFIVLKVPIFFTVELLYNFSDFLEYPMYRYDLKIV